MSVDRYTLLPMRKWIALFMMLLLPLQWTAALAAECCLRHDAQAEKPAVQHGAAQHEHQHHAQAEHKHKDVQKDVKQQDAKQQDAKQPDGKQAKNDCQLDCVGCHVHHCSAIVIDADTLAALPPVRSDDTPYLASITSPAPDNLLRPPLSRLA
jgi:hypothetical protein